MLGFFFFENLKNYQAQLFYVLRFPLWYLKTAQKMTKTISPLLGDPISYINKIPFLKKLTLWLGKWIMENWLV